MGIACSARTILAATTYQTRRSDADPSKTREWTARSSAFSLSAATTRFSEPVPPWAIKTAVLLATVWTYGEYALRDMLPEMALGRFMIWVCICKFLERKSNRDYGQLLVVSLLLLVGIQRRRSC